MKIEVGIMIAILSFALGFLGHWQRTKNDAESKATEKAVMSTKLDHIDTGVRDIQVQVRNTDNRIDEIKDRVIKVEESAKSAHRRLDKMEG